MDKKTPDEIAYLKTIENMNEISLRRLSPYKPIKLLSTSALAKQLDIAQSTLREYRLEHKGPAYIKIGHLVRYKLTDVEAWLAKLESGNI